MILDRLRKYDSYEIDGVPGYFWAAPDGVKVSRYFSYSVRALREQLGDYGRFTDSNEFCREGNLFADLDSMAGITPRQHEISSEYRVVASNWMGFRSLDLYKPLMLSLPSNDDVKSLLTSFSTRLTNRYLVTRIIQCRPNYPSQPGSSTPLYRVAKPFVWHRNKNARSGLEVRPGDELQGEAKGDQVRVNDVDEMTL